MTAPPIGIDLGTTNTCTAVYRNGAAEVVPDEQGKKTTPSFVSFGAQERKIGGAAQNQAARNPENTIFGAKRLIGMTIDDAAVKGD